MFPGVRDCRENPCFAEKTTGSERDEPTKPKAAVASQNRASFKEHQLLGPRQGDDTTPRNP